MAWRTHDHTLQLAEGHIEVRCAGPAPQQAPTIILLHEGLGCLSRWRDFPERLAVATGMGVLAFSRFGYGRSSSIKLPRPLDYMTREAVTVLPAVIAAYRVSEFFLIGHSDGGSIASVFAARVQNPAAMVLLAPHFFVEDCCTAAITEVRQAFEMEDLAERMAPHHNDVQAAFRGWCDAWLDEAFIRDWNLEADIYDISCPVLAIQGLEDPYGTRAQYRRWEGRRNFKLLMLPECGHNPVAEQTEQTFQEIVAFLEANAA